MKTKQHLIQPHEAFTTVVNLILRTLVFTFFHFSSGILIGQAPIWLWAEGIYGAGVKSAESMVIDASGNVYTTGYYDYIGPISMGNLTLDGGGAFVTKQDGAGNFLWAKRLGNTYTFGTSIAIDASGNLYTSGTFSGTTDFDPGSGTYNLASAGATDIYISKLNSSGNFVWAKRIGGTLADGNTRSCLTVNPDNGDVYHTGYFKGTADFDPGSGTSNLVSAGGDDIFISALDGAGNFIWANKIGGTGSDIAKSIARDDSGNLLTTGAFAGTVDFDPGSGTSNLSGGGPFILKLDESGSFVFAKQVGNETSNAITVDVSGNIYTTGSFTEIADFDPGSGVFNLTATGDNDMFVSKLDDLGNFVWAKGMGGISYEEGFSIAVDASESVFTTGIFNESSDFDPGSGVYNIISTGGLDVFYSRLDGSGNYVHAESAGGVSNDYGNFIVLDGSGSGIIAGQYESYLFWIGPYMLDLYDPFGSGPDAFIAKFIADGGAPLSVNISGTNVLCNGAETGSATATASGGIPPYEYLWSNGATSSTINNLAAGTYSVTVTAINGSNAGATVTISQPTPLVFNAPIINSVSCFGGNNGSIQSGTTGGVPPYSFEWSNGSTTAYIADLSAGSYTVTVTDNNDCTKAATYEVTQPSSLDISLENLNNESCLNESDGSISISITGGVNPYVALWSTGFTGPVITGLSPGDYSVTVSDDNLCTTTASYVIIPGGVVQLGLNDINHVTCAGGSNGSISIMAAGGVEPYSFSWSNGATDPIITGLTTGMYQVTTTDLFGCSTTGVYVITEPLAIEIQIMQPTQNLCSGDSTADLVSIASGGVGPYSALWSNGISGFENPNLAAGTYSITITDAGACTSQLSDTITDPLQLLNMISYTNETANGANDGTALSIPAGGTPPYNYLWNTGDTVSGLSGLSPGTYTVTIIDTNGCLVEGAAIVNAFGCALDIALGPDLIICDGDTNIITPGVNGPAGNVSYLWSDGSSSSFLQITESGTYCVTITDAANCQDLDCIEVTEIVIPSLTCPAINESAPGANDGAIQCDSLSGIVSYLWSNGATTSSIEGLSPGQYCLTVTEVNGCTKSQCYFVQPGDCQLTVNSVITNVLCSGEATGSVALTADNGTDPITYIWSNGQSDSLIENLVAGNYAVTVAEASGCVSLQSFIISEPPPMSVAIDSIAPADATGSGLIWITATGGIPDYTYQWVDPLGEIILSEDLNNLTQSGNYSLVLTDAVGCVTILDSFYVDQNVAVDHTSSLKSIRVYPVPAKDVLMVNTVYSIEEVFITGVDGRVYKHFIKPGGNRFDVADLGPGWYVLRMFDGRDWYVARMVK